MEPDRVAASDSNLIDSWKRRLTELYVRGGGIDVEYQIREGKPSSEILSTAKEVACDLIVMGRHERSWSRRLVMGSVAESVLHRADCLVLLIKAPQQEQSALPERAADERGMTSDDPPAWYAL